MFAITPIVMGELMTKDGWSPWAAFFVAMLLPLTFGLLYGVITTRTRYPVVHHDPRRLFFAGRRGFCYYRRLPGGVRVAPPSFHSSRGQFWVLRFFGPCPVDGRFHGTAVAFVELHTVRELDLCRWWPQRYRPRPRRPGSARQDHQFLYLRSTGGVRRGHELRECRLGGAWQRRHQQPPGDCCRCTRRDIAVRDRGVDRRDDVRGDHPRRARDRAGPGRSPGDPVRGDDRRDSHRRGPAECPAEEPRCRARPVGAAR